jgi:hypothetical protein
VASAIESTPPLMERPVYLSALFSSSLRKYLTLTNLAAFVCKPRIRNFLHCFHKFFIANRQCLLARFRTPREASLRYPQSILSMNERGTAPHTEDIASPHIQRRGTDALVNYSYIPGLKEEEREIWKGKRKANIKTVQVQVARK